MRAWLTSIRRRTLPLMCKATSWLTFPFLLFFTLLLQPHTLRHMHLSPFALQDETESDSVKAEKARARAHRDRLAQMALERRAKKAEFKAEADALANMQV